MRSKVVTQTNNAIFTSFVITLSYLLLFMYLCIFMHTLLDASKEFCLETRIITHIRYSGQNHKVYTANSVFKNVAQFKYF